MCVSKILAGSLFAALLGGAATVELPLPTNIETSRKADLHAARPSGSGRTATPFQILQILFAAGSIDGEDFYSVSSSRQSLKARQAAHPRYDHRRIRTAVYHQRQHRSHGSTARRTTS